MAEDNSQEKVEDVSHYPPTFTVDATLIAVLSRAPMCSLGKSKRAVLVRQNCMMELSLDIMND